ncbi:non-homologous end-joining DNA ligase [Pendulispora brunnea]|uniref:DNA ligase (ATP) n=1 Tax=Pendulispora brunnea TaxID=2905690 RepID=A0ABZ2KNJ9_9BACT
MPRAPKPAARRPASRLTRGDAAPLPSDGAAIVAALYKAIPPPPQAPVLVDKLADVYGKASDWQVQTKWDGYRCLAYCDGDYVELRSRNDTNLTSDYPDVVRELQALRLKATVLDGEVCAFDDRGLTSFALLRSQRSHPVPIAYAVFDVLGLDGSDLRKLPIEHRQQALLKRLGPRREGASVFVSTGGIVTDLSVAADVARENGLEGLVFKRLGSTYRAGKSRDWLKIKFRLEQEFSIVGYTPRKGSSVVGALLLAVATPDGYAYAGKVGTGLNAEQESALARELNRDASPVPTAAGAPTSILKRARWAFPRLVAQVAYLERDGSDLRHSSFIRLRDDKLPEQCVWEVAGNEAEDASPRERRGTSKARCNSSAKRSSGPRQRRS